MSEPIAPDGTEGAGWGRPSSIATLPPAGAGGSWPLPAPPPGGPFGPVPPEAPPARPSRNFSAAIAAAVALAVAALIVVGPLRDRVATTPILGTPATAPRGIVSGNSLLTSADVASIAAKVDKGVVDINTELGYQGGRAAGTGMILTASGEVLTNNHVIDGSTKITVTVVDTGRTYNAHVVGTDPTDDVAVIQMDGASGLKPITTARASTVAVGDAVVAIGNAGGRGGTPSAVAGTVLALGQTITATDDNGANAEQLTDLIQTDAPIESGDSGGPLANRAGAVIGMDAAAEVSGNRFRAAATSGYAIPIEKAIAIAQQIESGKASSTIHIGLPGFLGVQMAGTVRGAQATAGALVAGVESGTPAASIGLAAGDTITSVNGQAVASASQFSPLLHAAKPGDKVSIGWTDRAGTTHTATANLITGPAD